MPGRFANIALVAISLGLAYLLLELVLFPAVLPHLPPYQHLYLGRMGILAQTSKSGTVPIDYIALAGDSYAQGKGDWFREVGRKDNGPFHSAHILHQLSGRDVVTFGRGGIGSLMGLAGEPLAQYHYVDGSPWFALDPPRLIIAYVYEGNDFDDNIRRMSMVKRQMSRAKLDIRGTTDGDDAAKLERYVAEWSERFRRDGGTAATPVLIYALNAVVGTYDTIANAEAGRLRQQERKLENLSRQSDGPIVALVAGERQVLPDWLQGPAMQLTWPEIDMAVLLLGTSLAALHRGFPDSDLVVAYLPSPLTTYRLVSDTVSIHDHHQRRVNFAAAEVAPRSNRLCRAVWASAVDVGARFFDARPAMRAAGESRLIHGPKDWYHLNREGYTALGQAVYDFLFTEGMDDSGCAVL